MSRIPEEQKKKLVEFIMKVTGATEEDAEERIERIITKYPVRKIIVAINSMIQFDWKRARKKPIRLEELEKKIQRVRF